jgi:hypothetical protein
VSGRSLRCPETRYRLRDRRTGAPIILQSLRMYPVRGRTLTFTTSTPSTLMENSGFQSKKVCEGAVR